MFRLGCENRVCAQNEILSGLTVALALVPEAVAFAFVAGVDPLVGLYAAFMVGLLASAGVYIRRPSGNDLGCHRCHGGGDGLAGG